MAMLTRGSDEHYKRSSDCPFFILKSQLPPPKKSRATKTARASKAASRLSGQSVATVATDHQSLADMTANHDDSVMTTASTMTQGGKKSTRTKKATTAKPRKTRAKKEDAVEILEDEPEQIPEPPAKPARGRKRASDAVEDSVMTNAEAPPAKKRAARGKKAAAEPAAPPASSQELEMEDAPVKPARKGRASTAKATAKASQASLRAQALAAEEAEKAAEDEEIDRQLQADLDRPLTDDEDLAVDSDAERRKVPAPAKERTKKAAASRKLSSQSQKQTSKAYAMLDPTPAAPSEADVEADLVALQAEVQADEAPEPETLAVPRKGRKAAAPRKVSKQTKRTKQPQPASDPVDEAMDDEVLSVAPAPAAEVKPKSTTEPEQVEQAQDPDASSQTLKRGRGRPPKRATTSQGALEPEPRRSSGAPVQIEVQIESSRLKESFTALKETANTSKISRKPVPATAPTPIPTPSGVPVPVQSNATSSEVTSPRAVRVDKSLPPAPQSATRLPRPPTTPRKNTAPSASAKQATISPSQSPQSSDAENQAPSSRPAASAAAKRVVLAPVAATPTRGSPSKRHAVGGLQSTMPWAAVDLDMVFSPDKENGVDKLLRKGGELTSPEKNMTVEEWIYHNAGLAEQKLKEECEAMVSSFEKEGTRAMHVLEGLVVD